MNEISYYESHVTIVKETKSRLAEVMPLASQMGFKFAHLTAVSNGLPDKYSYILTGHDKQREHLLSRMVGMIKLLKLNGYKIERYKIEDISLDSRVQDCFGLLG